MAIQALNTIKDWFKTGLKPTQKQFWDTWDSFRHKNEMIALTDVKNLSEELNSKLEEADFKTINGESIVGFGDILINKDESNPMTRSELEFAAGNGDIIIGKTYKILNVDENWANVYLKGISPTQVSTQGLGEFKVPQYSYNSYRPWNKNMEGSLFNVIGDFQTNESVVANNGAVGIYLEHGIITYVSGDWNNAKSIIGTNSNATGNVSVFTTPDYSTGTVVSWGNNHWRNVTGNIGDALDSLKLNSDWELYQNNMLLEYDVIEYNYQHDYIYYRKDKRGNELSTKERYLAGKNFNPLKVFRWGDDNVYSNKFINSYIEICNKTYWKVANNSGTDWIVQDNIGSAWNIIANKGTGANISNNIGLGCSIHGNNLQYSYIQRNHGTFSINYNDFNVVTIADNFMSGFNLNGNRGFNWDIQTNTFKGNLSSRIENNIGNYWRIELLSGNQWTLVSNIGNNWRITNNDGNNWDINYNTGGNWNVSNNTANSFFISSNSGSMITLTNQSTGNKNFSFNYINGLYLYNDMPSSAILFKNYTKNLYTKPDGTLLIAYFDNDNTFVTSKLTD